VDIVKPPQVKSLPDILSAGEISIMIKGTKEARYQTFILTAYSMGLRLGETLNLTIADIDADYPRVHIRRGKSHKDRYVALPRVSLLALRRYWASHRHPTLIFPAGNDAGARASATVQMDRGGIQKHVHVHTLRHC
jgi:integrase